MEKAKLLQVVLEQFEDSNAIQLTEDTDFKALESFDSLTGMCIIVAMKDEFDKEISEAEFREIKTVNELYDLITA